MVLIDNDPGFLTKTSCIQLAYGAWVNLTCLSIGLAYGFPAVQIPQLNSPDSSILLSVQDTSWIASILALFCPIGCMFSGFLMDKIGRSKVILFCQIPMLIGWMYTGISRSAQSIIIGRAMTGIGCGMAMGPPRLYTAEISLPNMRGVLSAFLNLFISLGITLQALLGSYFNWKKLCYLCAAYNLMLFLSYIFLNETPYYLLLKDTTEHATKALSCFRAKNYHVEKEMNTIINFKQENDIRSLSFLEKIKACFSRAACKPFSIIVTYIILGQLSGISIVMFWAVEILQLSNSSIDEYTGNVFICSTRVIFGIISAVLLYKVTRKCMALTSAVGVGVVSLMLGVLLHFTNESSVIPLLLFMLYTAFACLGYYVLPFLLMSELYPLQIRGTLNGITISIINLNVFGCNLCYPYLRDAIGLANIMLLFGGVSFLLAIFLYHFFPETKNLTLQEIEEYYNKRRPVLVSQRQLVTQQLTDPTKTIFDEDEGDLNKKSFVDITSIASSSVTSVSKKRSVSLLIGGKQFKSLTAAEDAELQKELRELQAGVTVEPENDLNEIPLPIYFFDEPDHTILHKKKHNSGKKLGDLDENVKTLTAAKTVTSETTLEYTKDLSESDNSRKIKTLKPRNDVTSIKKNVDKTENERKIIPGNSKAVTDSKKDIQSIKKPMKAIENKDDPSKSHAENVPNLENGENTNVNHDQNNKKQSHKKDTSQK